MTFHRLMLILMTRFFQSLLAVLAAASGRQLAKYVPLFRKNRIPRNRLPIRVISHGMNGADF